MIWDPSWWQALLFLLALVCVPMFLGVPVVFAFFLANVVGVFLFKGGYAGLVQMPAEVVEALTLYSYVAVPLFILMGEVLFHTGLAFRAINAIDRLITGVPGRLSIVAVAGGTVFAALSGSTIANTAILGNTLLPDMLKRGYDPRMAMGPIMAVGGVAMLIPPSALAVLLASLAEKPAKGLLIAGIVPGLIMSVLFAAYIIVRCHYHPALAPAAETPPQAGDGESRWKPFLRDVLPLALIFLVVVGSIILGLATPEDSAALGALAAVIASIAYGVATPQNLLKAFTETAKTTVMLLFIIAGSLTFTQLLSITGALDGVLDWMVKFNMTQTQAVLMMVGILLFLGMFMDQVSMVLLTLPVFLKISAALAIPDTWLLLLILVSMEIGLLTPPFGLLLFVMKGVAPPHIRLATVYAAAFPFVLIEIFVVGLLIAFPALALFLPRLFDS